MPKKVIAFVARQHGLNGLQALLSNPNFDVIAVATHKRLQKVKTPIVPNDPISKSI